jgi:hypothetical protein
MIKFIEENFEMPISPMYNKINTKIKLFNWQKDAIKTIENNITTILVTARQIGSSVALNAYGLSYALLNPNSHILIVGYKAKNAEDYCTDIKSFYNNMPRFTVTLQKDEIAFENGSVISFIGQSANLLRGRRCNVVICHDFAFYNNQKKLVECISPCLTKNGKIILQSCPNGKNYFYKLAKKNKKVYDW